MPFYSSISKVYDWIFPLNPAQVKFLSSIYNMSQKLIEIGSATGSLSIELSNSGFDISGLEYDSEMIEIARKKGKNIDWIEGSMLDIDQLLLNKKYDGLICLGNTLVHLKTIYEIESFLKKACSLLRRKSIITIQIINYSRIFDKNIDHLPTIENDKIRFMRKYTLTNNPRNVEFSTELLIKETNQILENSINLFPIFPSELVQSLKNEGFRTFNEYSDFNGNEFNPKSIPYIITAVKE